MSKFILSLILLTSILIPAHAQSRKAIERSTDVLMFVNPVAGFVGSLAIGDYKGTKQIVIGGASTLAASYILKYSIKKERPDGSNHRSFPSYHTAASLQGAAFLQRRYGWKFGIPAYAITAYVGWGRVYAKKHDIWDVLGGAAIGAAGGYIFTRPFAQKHNLTLAPTVSENGIPGFYASMTF